MTWVWLIIQFLTYCNPGAPKIASGSTIPILPPGFKNSIHLSINKISGATDL